MGAAIPAALRAEVRALDNERCAYCLAPEELTVTPFEVDHNGGIQWANANGPSDAGGSPP